MCRIFGYIGHNHYDTETLKKVSQLQLHGGPDQQSFVQKANWALGNNRLAIQGIEGGKQPFALGDQIYAVLNGEIYNHRELAAELTKKGYTFADECDGTILPALYREHGENFVRYLDGMFAIGLIDCRGEKPELILASDPAGIKSIYYQYDSVHRTLKFASEIPALLGFGDIKSELRPEAIDEYFTSRAILGQKTIYKNIMTLPPATLLKVKNFRAPQLTPYDSALKAPFEDLDLINAGAKFNNLLEDEMSRIMDADVPICVLTSGGLDSSYLTALASQFNSDLHSFNVWYKGNWPSDERHYAEEVSKMYGTTHHQVEVDPLEFPSIIKKMVKHLGQPNSAPHCLSTYALYQAVHEAGFKAAVVGEGADDFFGGYDRFVSAVHDPSEGWLDSYLNDLSAVKKSIRSSIYHDDYSAHLRSQDIGQHDFIKNDILRRALNGNNRLESLLTFEQSERLPYYIFRRVDHLSMAHAVEVRVPFCQPKIMSIAHQINSDLKVKAEKGKRIIYQAAVSKLPHSVLNRPKQPFTLPITAMLQRGNLLFDFVYETLKDSHFSLKPIFNVSAIDALLDQQLKAPDQATANTLWSLLILELWTKENNERFA